MDEDKGLSKSESCKCLNHSYSSLGTSPKEEYRIDSETFPNNNISTSLNSDICSLVDSVISHSDSSNADSLDLALGMPKADEESKDIANDVSRSQTDKEYKGIPNDNATTKVEPLIAAKTRTSVVPKSLSKSKTFDSSSLRYSKGKNASKLPNFVRSTTPNKAHVFMTSQECVVIPGSSKLPRPTIASRLRYEKQHDGHNKECTYGDYDTPTQRKDQQIKDLKRTVKELNTTIEQKNRDIEMYKQSFSKETASLLEAKDEQIASLREEVNNLQKKCDELASFCDESIETASSLEARTEDLKRSMFERERQHERLYLEMYRKGQDSARFEREEELERLASAGGCTVTISELVKKLALTEMELGKWQTIRRRESYHEGSRPETDAQATLRFLKDSFFHYLTDDKDWELHLNAMIRIFSFTDAQLKRIKHSKHLEKSKNKKDKKK